MPGYGFMMQPVAGIFVIDWHQVWSGLGLFGVTAGLAFLVIVILSSYLRFQNMTARAVEATYEGTDEETFAFRIAARLAMVRRSPPPMLFLLLDPGWPDFPDEARRKLVDCVQSCVRRSDDIVSLADGRIGLILTLDQGLASGVADRILRDLSSRAVRAADGTTRRLAPRAGAVLFPDHAGTLRELMDGMEQALEAARAEEHVLWRMPPQADPERAEAAEAVEAVEDGGGEASAPRPTADEPAGARPAAALPSYVDPLTGLLKSERSGRAVQKMIAQARRDEDRVSVLILSLQNVEQHRRHYGDEAADAIIKRAADLILACTRESDLAGRWGREGFILAIGCPLEEARTIALRLQNAFRTLTVTHGGRDLRGAFHIGLAAYPEQSVRPREVVEAALAALDEARGKGRNIWMAYEGEYVNAASREAMADSF
jgi:diguanylate cyclase (GGDEF)-like protein